MQASIRTSATETPFTKDTNRHMYSTETCSQRSPLLRDNQSKGARGIRGSEGQEERSEEATGRVRSARIALGHTVLPGTVNRQPAGSEQAMSGEAVSKERINRLAVTISVRFIHCQHKIRTARNQAIVGCFGQVLMASNLANRTIRLTECFH
jgi:hypothetical protein